MKVPDYYLSRKFQNTGNSIPLIQRLDDRIEDIKRKLPHMSLVDKQRLWSCEPYWEVSELIQKSDDFVFPSK